MEETNKFNFHDLKTIPNILSVSRLVLIPTMLIPCFLIGDEPLARKVFLIMFVLIGITDKLDKLNVIKRKKILTQTLNKFIGKKNNTQLIDININLVVFNS